MRVRRQAVVSHNWGCSVSGCISAKLGHPPESFKRRLWVCAVKRWRFPAGVSPARQPLQPEATYKDFPFLQAWGSFGH
jgi:hypothetical protein